MGSDESVRADNEALKARVSDLEQQLAAKSDLNNVTLKLAHRRRDARPLVVTLRKIRDAVDAYDGPDLRGFTCSLLDRTVASNGVDRVDAKTLEYKQHRVRYAAELTTFAREHPKAG